MAASWMSFGDYQQNYHYNETQYKKMREELFAEKLKTNWNLLVTTGF